MNSKGKWTAGTLLAIAGAFFAGWLTAPKSGKETREDIKVAANKAKAGLEKQLSRLHDELVELIAESKSKGAQLKDKAKVEFDELLAKAVVAKEKSAVMLNAAKSGQAEDPDLAKAVEQAKLAKENLQKYWAK